MKLFVGLGNPGGEYAGNRHNVGFMAVDRIAQAHGFGPWRSKFQGLLADGRLDGEKCLLFKPSTFMNESGRAVREAAGFYKLDTGDVIVFYDELDLAPGKVRVKTGGGTAGHNGIRSLASHLGADFARVRIGIGHPGDKSKVQGYVLRDFAKADGKWLEPLLDALAGNASKLAGDDAAGFMNAVALATQQETPDAPKQKKTGTKPSRPSQRDLARKAAAQSDKRDKQQETDDDAAQGPFARLRNLFGAGDK